MTMRQLAACLVGMLLGLASARADVLNVWHIPTNEEPPTVTMRNPVVVHEAAESIYFYLGGWPIGTIWSAVLHYRTQGQDWSEQDLAWDSNHDPNEYFYIGIANVWQAGQTVEYYLEASGSPATTTTFVYGDDSHSNTTAEETVAAGAPYGFTLIGGSTPTATPTPAGTPSLLNVWHVPANEEPPSVTMRHPLAPQAGDPVAFYLGGWPQGSIWSGRLHFRVNGGQYSSLDLAWDSNQGENEYFVAVLTGGLTSGDLLEYYLEAANPSFVTTFIYGSDDSSNTTAGEPTAQAAPYQASVGGATATPTPHATALPTSTPTPAGQASPTPTATPAAGEHGVEILLAADRVAPGQTFWVRAALHNPYAAASDVPLAVVLDVYGELWFWPSWAHYAPPAATGFDYRRLDVPHGRSETAVIDPFSWPATGAQEASGLYFHGAMLTSTMDALWGELGSAEWGYGPATSRQSREVAAASNGSCEARTP